MMSNRQRKSTVREDRRGNRLATTALACAGTIALAIVAFANAGQVGADTRWAGDSDFGAPYPTEVAEGCGSEASTASLGGSSYESAPQDHDCPAEVSVEGLRDIVGCLINAIPFLGGYRCRYDDTCKLERKFELTVSVTVTSEDGTFSIERTETEKMCGYGDCGDFNVAGVPQ